VERKQKTKFAPLYAAAVEGHTEVVKYLLEQKANPEELSVSKLQNTPLTAAATNGHNVC
jgi:ankyrin repeat protein